MRTSRGISIRIALIPDESPKTNISESASSMETNGVGLSVPKVGVNDAFFLQTSEEELAQTPPNHRTGRPKLEGFMQRNSTGLLVGWPVLELRGVLQTLPSKF